MQSHEDGSAASWSHALRGKSLDSQRAAQELVKEPSLSSDSGDENAAHLPGSDNHSSSEAENENQGGTAKAGTTGKVAASSASSSSRGGSVKYAK